MVHEVSSVGGPFPSAPCRTPGLRCRARGSRSSGESKTQLFFDSTTHLRAPALYRGYENTVPAPKTQPILSVLPPTGLLRTASQRHTLGRPVLLLLPAPSHSQQLALLPPALRLWAATGVLLFLSRGPEWGKEGHGKQWAAVQVGSAQGTEEPHSPTFTLGRFQSMLPEYSGARHLVSISGSVTQANPGVCSSDLGHSPLPSLKRPTSSRQRN